MRHRLDSLKETTINCCTHLDLACFVWSDSCGCAPCRQWTGWTTAERSESRAWTRTRPSCSDASSSTRTRTWTPETRSSSICFTCRSDPSSLKSVRQMRTKYTDWTRQCFKMNERFSLCLSGSRWHPKRFSSRVFWQGRRVRRHPGPDPVRTSCRAQTQTWILRVRVHPRSPELFHVEWTGTFY